MGLEGQQSFKILKELGGGGFATAFKAQVLNPKILKKWRCNETVVIKVPNDEESAIDLSNEIELNSAMRVNCTKEELDLLCEVYGTYSLDTNFGSKLVMVMEYMPEGNLRNKIQSKSCDTSCTLEYLKNILLGLSIVHKNKIIHRDIKPENILFKNNKARITDLGIGRAMHDKESTKTIAGTLFYMAPEMLMNKKGYTYNVDIWSVGIMLHEMLFECLPLGMEYSDPQGVIVSKIVSAEDYKKPDSSDIPAGLDEILKRALNKDSKKRYQTANEMLDDIKKYEHSIIKQHPEYIEFLTKRNSGRNDEAIVLIKNLISQFNECSDLHYELGCIYNRQSEFSKAFDAFRTGIENIPDNGKLYMEAGKALYNSARSKEAISYLEKAIELGISKRKKIISKTIINNIKRQQK